MSDRQQDPSQAPGHASGMRKQDEEALRFKEQLIEAASAAVCSCDLDGNMLSVNTGFLQTWGYESAAQVLGRPFQEFWMVQDRLDEIISALRQEKRWSDEHKARRKDGTIFDVLVTASLVLDSTGKPIALMSTSVDITDRKQAEALSAQYRKELDEINRIGTIAGSTLELEDVLKNILENVIKAVNASFGMISLCDPVSGNLTWGADFGLSEEFVNHFKEIPLRKGEGLAGTIAQTGVPIFIMENSANDPRIARPFIVKEANSFLGVPIFAENEIVGVMDILTRYPARLKERDIHFCSAVGSQVGLAIINAKKYNEQKKMKESLRESEELLSRAEQIGHIGSWVYDSPANRLTWSDEVYRIFGFEPQEFAPTYEAFLNAVHPDDRAAVDDANTGSFREGRDSSEIEHRIIRRDSGETRYVFERCIHERNDDGSLLRSIGMVQDITERKAAELIKEFQLTFQEIAAETSAVLVGVADDAEFNRGVNRALERLGELFRTDRSYLFQFSEDLVRMSCTHEWCAPGVEAQMASIQNQPTGDLPWWKAQIIKKKPFQIPDVSALPLEAQAEKREFASQGILSLVCLPTVGSRGRLTGFIGFDMVRQTHSWPQEQITMLQLVADIIGGALERKRIDKALSERLAFEKMIARISTNFINLPLEQIDCGINDALKSIGEFFDVDRSYIYRFSEDGLTYSNTHLWHKNEVEGFFEKNQDFPVELTPWWVNELKSGRLVNIADVSQMPEEAALDRADFLSEEIKSLFTLPLTWEGKVFGCFGFDTVSAHRIWTEEELNLLQVVAELISGAIARHDVDRQIRLLSFHDQLTGLYNRRYFEHELERLDRSREHPVAVVSADLDGLKRVNDTNGHREGDRYLQAGADLLKKTLRTSDILARVGGDEFVLLLPHTDKAAAELLVNRIRCRIEQYNHEQEGLPLSISFGLAVCESADYPLEETYRMADKKMYTDKLQQRKKTREEIIASLLPMLSERDSDNLTEGERDQVQELVIRLGKALELTEG